MEKYEFLSIDKFNSQSCKLKCTHTSEVEFLRSQINQFFPKYEFGIEKLPSGEIYAYCFTSGASGGDAVLWWTIKQLCLRGWEPMGATSSGVAGGTFYNFKRKVLP